MEFIQLEAFLMFNEALLLSGCLIAYYFLAETWFAVLFTVIVEIVPPEIRWKERVIFIHSHQIIDCFDSLLDIRYINV